jgi:hypothetical protein
MFKDGSYEVSKDMHERRTPPMTPLKAVRARCLDCRGYEMAEVRECDFANCPFHSLSMGRGSRSVLKPVRAYCLWCCNDQRGEVRECPSIRCPLWQYRLGRRRQTGRVSSKNGATERVFVTNQGPVTESIGDVSGKANYSLLARLSHDEEDRGCRVIGRAQLSESVTDEKRA